MKRTLMTTPLLFLLAAGAGSCTVARGDKATPPEPEVDHPMQKSPVQATWTDEPLVIDGRLDEPVWRQAPAYPLVLPEDHARDDGGREPHEAGTVRFAWGPTHFYAAFAFTDRDVVQETDEDQQRHYRTGDVAELFLKPAAADHYWEYYATPNAKKTAFFYPGRGRLGLPSTLDYPSDLEVAATVDGTLNNWRDDDRGWTAEMAIPLAELAAAGVPLDLDHPWTLLVGRYNFGRHLPTLGPELSSFPPLPVERFHLHEAYAAIRLFRPERP